MLLRFPRDRLPRAVLTTLLGVAFAVYTGGVTAQQISRAEQQARDNARIKILQDELTQEQRALAEAKTPEEVELHQRNVKALLKELAPAAALRPEVRPPQRRHPDVSAVQEESVLPQWSIYARRAKQAKALVPLPSDTQEKR
ncbi:MAG: hypothetical protein WCA12_18585 [Burkholderiales bacterium]